MAADTVKSTSLQPLRHRAPLPKRFDRANPAAVNVLELLTKLGASLSAGVLSQEQYEAKRAEIRAQL